jgi:hypothetical protein
MKAIHFVKKSQSIQGCVSGYVEIESSFQNVGFDVLRENADIVLKGLLHCCRKWTFMSNSFQPLIVRVFLAIYDQELSHRWLHEPECFDAVARLGSDSRVLVGLLLKVATFEKLEKLIKMGVVYNVGGICENLGCCGSERLTCSVCGIVSYCSANCRQHDAYRHKEECENFVSVAKSLIEI